MDLNLWSFALQLWVLIWVDSIKTYLFVKPELHKEAAGASRGINKTISSKQLTVKACFNFLPISRVPDPLKRVWNCIGATHWVLQGRQHKKNSFCPKMARKCQILAKNSEFLENNRVRGAPLSYFRAV